MSRARLWARRVALSASAAWVGTAGPVGADERSLRQEEIVARAMLIGASRWEIVRLSDRREPQAVIEEARARWRLRPAPILFESHGRWQSLTQLDGDWIETLTVGAAGSGTEGTRVRVRADRTDRPSSAWIDGWLPAGAIRLNRFDHVDDRQRVTTLIYRSPVAPSASLGALRRQAREAGFGERLPGAQGLERLGDTGASAAGTLFVGRRDEELAIAASGDGSGCFVVINWRRR